MLYSEKMMSDKSLEGTHGASYSVVRLTITT